MTHDTSNFLRELAEASRALENEPNLLARIDELSNHNAKLSETVAAREIHILSLKQEIEGLQAKVRSAEVERDDAGFRQLEAEDKANALILALRSVSSTVGDALRVIEPEVAAIPLPEHAVDHSGSSFVQPVDQGSIGSSEPKPESGERVVDPTPVQQPQIGTGTANEASSFEHTTPSPTSGQSDPLPTASMILTPSQTAPYDTAELSGSVSLQGSEKPVEHTNPATDPGPYFGKRYADHPYFVSEEGWVRGGGTLEDYHWKPAANS